MRHNSPRNRKGITLLFVVSMIVLFLLMGTAFVIVSNDFFSTAKRRSVKDIHNVDGSKFVERGLFSFLRGPDLTDGTSPLRGLDLLSDMYGYGYKAHVTAAAPFDNPRNPPGPSRLHLIRLQLSPASRTVPTATGSTRNLLGLRSIYADARTLALSGPITPNGDLVGGVFNSGTGLLEAPGGGKVYVPELDVPGYFGGQVLSFVSGPARGVSGRIVDYTVVVDETTGVVNRTFVVAVENVTASDTPFDNQNITLGGINTTEIAALGEIYNGSSQLVSEPSLIVINGRPFSGHGAGVSAFDAENVDDASAFRPNCRQYPGNPAANSARFFTEYATRPDSVNEPHDAFDHDNIFLAQKLPVGQVASYNPVQLDPKFVGANAGVSEHEYSLRPVYQWTGETTETPLGSNTANEFFPNVWNNEATPIPPATLSQNRVPHKFRARPLDVDNDGDGILDSVWIDTGEQPFVNEDGVLVKPLVAPMIVELDSRFNLNVHGNIADADGRATVGGTENGYLTLNNLIGNDTGTPANSATLARGLGMGPPEISLASLFPGQDYRSLLIGFPLPDSTAAIPFSQVPVIPGRYGFDRLPGSSFFDVAAQWRFLHYPPSGPLGSTFQGRAMDIHGRFATGFPATYATQVVEDPSNPGTTITVRPPVGMPIVDVATSSWPPVGPYSNADPGNPYPGTGTELYNSPYEVTLPGEIRSYQTYAPNPADIPTLRRSADTLFTPMDLEGFLRVTDIDSAMLSDRIASLGLSPLAKDLVTTESWEVPALPPMDEVETSLPFRVAPVNLQRQLYNILVANLTNGGPAPSSIHNKAFLHIRGGDASNSDIYQSLLAPEILRGLPMNLNRSFGDGDDTDGDGIIDEHWDSAAVGENEQAGENYPTLSVGFDYNNDGVINRQDRFARQIFARHLFVLAWLTTTPSPSTSTDPDCPDMNNNGTPDEPEDIFFLAQWCANVVDFRDADSICTPIEFDTNPWDGWDCDNDFTTTEATGLQVWGLERPELLLNEALATHERRWEDLDSDPQFKSRFVPKASVFVEVYNPWLSNNNTELTPAEFYNGGGVDLALTHDATAAGDPIWRMVFAGAENSSPTDTDSRRVYFREPSANVEAATTGNFFFTSLGTTPVPANGYAMIGSSGIEHTAGQFRTTFGRRNDLGAAPTDLRLDETQSITLIPGTGIDIYKWSEITSAFVTESRSCVAIPIDTKNRAGDAETRSLGITDPTAGYDPTGTLTQDIDPNGDADASDGDGKEFLAVQSNVADDPAHYLYNAILADGISNNKAYVQLQRLANPEVAFNATTNPYITVDVSPVDILSFNGISNTISTNPPVDTSAGMNFSTCERSHGDGGARLLWPQANPRTVADGAMVAGMNHFLDRPFTETLGQMNQNDQVGNTGTPADVQRQPFVWFTWNNRPFVSQHEIMSVPKFRAEEVLDNFDIAESHIAPFQTNFKRLLPFLEVPPRFVQMDRGFEAELFHTEQPTPGNSFSVYNPPYNFMSRYRYPGKVNVNTLTSVTEPVWTDGMMRNLGITSADLTSTTDLQFRDHTIDDVTEYDPGFIPAPTAVVQSPIRPDGVGGFDANNAWTATGTALDASWVRSGADNLFRSSSLPHDNTDRNFWFENLGLTKLGNIATNRSSVYAIWITVGYFAVDENGRLGAEVGSGNGESARNRGFFVFDRSIPVAFEPGKNHNIDRAILVKSIIE